MKIAQVSLAVPEEVYRGLMSGTLEITAGVVRDSKGIIRKHLPKVASEARAVSKNASVSNTMKLAKNIKIFSVAATVVTATGAGAAYLIHRAKTKKMEDSKARTEQFQKALQAYIEAANRGDISEELIEDLIRIINEFGNKRSKSSDLISISTVQMTNIIECIYDYTQRFAEANGFNRLKIRPPRRGAKNNIDSLQNYLQIQKQIFESAA